MRGTARELELLRRDVRDFKKQVTDWQEHHEGQHQDEAKAAVNGRRWVITTCLASLALLVTILALIADVLGRVRGLVASLARGPGRRLSAGSSIACSDSRNASPGTHCRKL